MEEDYEPAVQHQRRVNPKIHDVIKKEVEKLLDARLIYPISDSPWVSLVHCVPKKGGMTVVTNDENELVPTRLVIGWGVCIDYRKLNEATRKDHFPLPFMDQMLERLTGNEYYCFLDGFSGTDIAKISRKRSKPDNHGHENGIECAKAGRMLSKLTFTSGNLTPGYDPIVSNSSPTLTPFGDSDFLLLEETDAFLALADDPTSPEELKLCEAKTAKSLIDEPPEVELKDFPPHLEYVFLEDNNKLPVIISKDLSVDEKTALIKVLKSRKRAITWKLSDIKGINLEFCSHKILMEEDYEPAVQHQRRVNPKIHDVIKKEVEKLLDAGLIYPISDSPWVSPVHCVPKKGGMTVVTNDENELVPTRLVTGWRVCIDYRKLNEATRKDHFPLPFMDQMLERLAGNEYYCFLDGFSGYFQIPIDPKDQEKTTFTCPYGTFAYRRMPFGLCNAPGTFQRCMMAIFHDMIEKTMEVFMDDFSVFGNSFSTCLSNLEKMLKRCEDTNLALNWEKSHFMVKEGIVLGHKISKKGIEVDKAKIDVISKLPHPTTVKGIRSFLGHAGFYRRFIKDFSKISRPMTHLLEKNTPFIFLEECIQAFQILKKKLTEAPILIAPNWDQPFELMCDASDYAIGAVLGQRIEKHFRPIHYASKTMTEAETNYTTTEKEMLAVIDIFRKILDISSKVENQEFTKPPSSDTLREFLRGMYHKAKMDYAAIMWGDLHYQIDNRQIKVRRCEIMPYPRFTKAIIDHFMSQHKSISKREGLPYHTIADDGLLERLKFINKGDIYQVYGKPIPDTWITNEIKKSEAYQMYFKYSTGLIPPKKSRGRAVKEGKTTATTRSQLKPRKHHEKKKQDSCESLNLSQRASQLKHKTGSSSEGTGVSPGVPNELTGVLAVSSEGVGTSPKVLDETLYNYEAQSDDDVWGSTDEETNKDKNEDDDKDDSFDITNTDDERTESDSDNHEMSKEGETVAEIEEEETANSELEED
ncbi:reverse transcriptase domain-containing protein [Tanacetum coccineum]